MFRSLNTIALVVGLAVNANAQLPSLDAERSKNLGIAYLEEEQPRTAAEQFRRVSELMPQEVLGYANLAAAYLRMTKIEAALMWLDEAESLSPGHTHVLALRAEAMISSGNWSAATEALSRAIEASPDNPTLRYARLLAIESGGVDDAAERIAQDVATLVRLVPENPVVRLRAAKLSAEDGDFAAARDHYGTVSGLVEDAGVPSRATTIVDRGLQAENGPLVVRGLTVIENVLRPTEPYKQALRAIKSPVVGLPMLKFSDAFYDRLKQERPGSIPVIWEVRSGVETDAKGTSGRLDFADVNGDGIEDWLVSIDGEGGSTELFLSDRLGDENGTEPAFRHSLKRPPGQAHFVDYDNDGSFDLIGTGPDGVWLQKGMPDGSFIGVNDTSELAGINTSRLAVLDLDNEGDLDIVLAADDDLHFWQNRLDGRFRLIDDRVDVFGLPNTESILPLDVDDDGDTDLIVLDANGRLRLLDNRRLSRFVEMPIDDDRIYGSATAADVDNDGWVDLVAIDADGALVVKRSNRGTFGPAVTIDSGPVSVVEPLDFDNDGWTDLAVAYGEAVSLLRNDSTGEWSPLSVGNTTAANLDLGGTDVDDDGDLDLVVLDELGVVIVYENDGGNANNWLRVSLVGLQSRGTKNNLHGVGSRVEVKAGLHYQVQYASRPVTHFGLGKRDRADLVRVTWSNGVPQNVFQPETNQTIRERQVLKGSCPYLYVWDGKQFRFATDLLGAAPLGLQLADGVIAPDNPREILKIDTDMIAERDGQFVFQFTEELWETIYLDEVGLWVVDHPEGTEVFTDERFLPPPYPDLEVVTTRDRVYAESVTNTAGEDVTETLREYDYTYPNTFEATRYQGLVEPHRLTMSFGDVSGLANPMLVMRGWIFWTDTSINVNLSQGEAVRPDFPLIDVWKDGAWTTMQQPFGLPKGKDKWIVLDLAGHVDPTDARVRIRTNYQIYYDLAFLADAVAETGTRVTRLKASSADLHYGGFSEMVRPAPLGPHHYDYGKKVSLPVWKDMAGLATRYGDVTDLLKTTDDLMVVFTAGDEVTLTFDVNEIPELAEGMTRSYFFLSDGWDKDSDRNTITGDTVLPLPFHAMTAYPYPEGESFPNTEAHQRMIRETLTRKIGPEAYRDFVKGKTFSERPEALPWEETKYIVEGPGGL